MKFNHLNVPDQWQHYWTKYPEGYTILEALIQWVSQVDDMVDNQNKLNGNVDQFRKEIDDFVGRFDERLQYEVSQTLKDWQTSGFLDVVISEGLQWQLDDYIATNERDKNSFIAQLAQTSSELEDIALNINSYKTDSNNWNDAFELAYNALPENGGIIYIPNTIYINRSIDLKKLGVKKVLIRGKSKLNNPGTDLFNSVIIKQGDFDGVVLNNACGMENISVSRDKSFADEHDGIWVAGITCYMQNVFVNDQGGNGIRIGSKKVNVNSVKYNCNIGRFINVGSYNNTGWGIVVKDEFATGINTSDANAIMFLAPDCRDNKMGGMLFEDCMDSQVYSPDCEVNYGEAGIKIGDDAGGIGIYSAYTENNTTHEILLTEGSSQNIIIGYRRGGINDGITDLGVGNFILGKYQAKFTGHYIPNQLNSKAIGIGRKEKTGYFTFEQDDSNNLSIVSRGGAGKNLFLKSDSGAIDITLLLKNLILDGKDRLNSIRVRPMVTTGETIIPAGGSIFANRTGAGVKAGDFIVVNPYTSLPSGVSFYANCEIDDNVKITLVNGTNSTITVPAQNWRCIALNATSLS